MRVFLYGVIILIFLTGLSFGAGFGLGEFGGRAAGMGNAVTAQAYDASTLYYNPAGLGFLNGTQFYGGVTIISPAASFVGAEPYFDNTVYKAKDQIFPPVGIYATHRFNPQLAAGISLTTPFGLGLAWEEDFPGRAISKDVTLESYYVTPVLAYTVNENLSFSAGADFVISKLALKRNVLMFNTEGIPGTGTEVAEADISGTSKLGMGFIAGVMYRQDKYGVGVMYRHSVKNKVENGEAKFTIDATATGAAVASQILVDQKGGTEITYPNYFVAGIYYKILDNLGIEFDYAWYGWSVFDELTLAFDNPMLNQTIPENYKDEYQLRLGAHYDINEKFSVRAGFIYDRTPQPIESVSPLLPDDTRNDLSMGLGYKSGNFVIDGGYMFVNIGERSTVEGGVGKNDNGFNGTYNSHAHLFFLYLGYTLK